MTCDDLFGSVVGIHTATHCIPKSAILHNSILLATLCYDFKFFYLPIFQQSIKAEKLYEANKTWWGNFRTSWAVEHDGKWADLEYPCSGYPSFACGAGSLLTADVVKWIAMNHG